MSSITSKELLAKNLQKSHSSSSLLLSSANLSWSPSTGSAILVSPQPPIERPVSPSNSDSSKAMTNEELIQTIRLDSKTNSNQSIDVLEGFQTISLNECKDDNNDNKSVDSLHSNTSSMAEKKPSLLNQLFSTVGSNLISSQTFNNKTISESSSHSTTHLSNSYSNPNFGSFPSNSEQNVSRSSSVHSNISVGSPPPMAQTSLPPPPIAQTPLPPPPTEPPKGMVTKDYKIKGPLRLYDPNYGINKDVSPLKSEALPAQTFSPPEVTPFNQSFTSPSTEHLYNPNSFDSQTIESNVSSDDLNQTFLSPNNEMTPTIGTSVESDNTFISNTQQFSYISESQNQNFNDFTTEWTAAQITEQQSYPEQQYYQTMANTYQPLVHHWFYQKIIDNKEVWIPFSMYDSFNLEQAIISIANGYDPGVIATDGGRFDVSVNERLRRPVYWSEVDTIVRRCSWFFKKEGHNRWSPYTEDFAAKLEERYREAVINNSWNQKIEFESGSEVVVMHSFQSIYHYQSDLQMPDGWGQALENPIRPRLVHRGALDGIFDDIDEGEPEKIDHLLFLIHGVGEFCDFRFRSIVEVVDDFRSISLSQMRTNFKSYLETGQLGRIEILPIAWHSALHGEETGIDDRLKQITLESIPKLRHFSNDTILDALFYTSPVYCQTIVDNVGHELNRLWQLFCQRNPNFYGTVALGGHSLGSLIVFDLLAQQKPGNTNKKNVFEETTKSDSDQQLNEYFSDQTNQKLDLLLNSLGFPEYYEYLTQNHGLDFQSIILLTEEDLKQRVNDLPIALEKKLLNFIQNYNNFMTNSQKVKRRLSLTSNYSVRSDSPINYAFESLGLGFPSIKYPTLAFKPSAFFAMGSPIPMFLTVRGVEFLSPEYHLPTCKAVYNIFHPYDPIAYRLEPMIYRSFKDIKPVLIPHHKGRKRMHLELKESITRMGSDLKSKFLDSLKYTWNSINEFARAHKPNPQTSETDHNFNQNSNNDDFGGDSNQDINSYINGLEDTYGQSLSAGALNSGRRIDYVLQESPVEAFNEYLFAIRAHACYWSSEDTALLILRELYGQMGYYTTTGVPNQQTNEHTLSASASTNSFDISSSFDLTGQQFN